MTETAVRYEKDGDGIVVLTLDDPTSSANTMNELYTESMGAAVERLEQERDEIAGVVVTSAKKTFFAGGDLKRMVQAGPEDAPEIFAMAEEIKAQLRRLETLGKPVVAAINGTALGGGLEITLACHHRIAVDDSKIDLGLPEVSLGLLPGGGGVTRVVRMLGLTSGLMDVLLTGAKFKPAAAKEKGLVDGLVANRDDLIPAAKAWITANRDNDEAATQPWDRPGYKIPGGAPSHPKLAAYLPAFPANLRKQVKGADYPAPRAILSAAVEGAQVDFDTASRIESRYLTSLVVGQNSKNMIQAFFFDLQAINSGSLRPDGIEKYEPTRVGVLGAGMMGAGIAYSCARSGLEVVLKDVSVEAAEKGKAYSAKVLDKAVSRGQAHRGAGRRGAGPDYAGRRRRRAQGLRPGDRGGLRGPVAEGQGLRRGARRRQQRRAALLEHQHAADLRARRERRPAGGLHRAALLLARRQDAAGRDHPRRQDLRPCCGAGDRRRTADPQDADRGQRQPRLLHLAGDRHPDQRGPRDARRGGAADDDRARRHPGRLSGRPAADQRRAQPRADRQDSQRHQGRGREQRQDLRAAPGRDGRRHDDQDRSAQQAQGRRLLQVRRGRPAGGSLGRARRDVPGRRRAAASSTTSRTASCSSRRSRRPAASRRA